jgi:hypothetical protein
MTSEQMQDFYGWKHAWMWQENILTSSPAIMQIMPKPEQLLNSASWRWRFFLENVEATEEGVGSGFLQFVMEEDPEMYKVAGNSLLGTFTAHNSVNIKKNNYVCYLFCP